MKVIIIISALVALGAILMSIGRWAATTKTRTVVPASFYDLEVRSIEGDTIRMSDFEGKYVLCVNVASRCGFTPQYRSLQMLYEQYPDKLVIIGFPCNQFLMQEPGTEEEIAAFCEKNYEVTFPLTEKIKVKGGDQHPLYAWLTDKQYNGVADARVSWNFNKFLISPEGQWLAHFPSKVDPLDKEITGYLN